MKTNLPRWLVCFAILCYATSAFAWPFEKKTTSGSLVSGVIPSATIADFDEDGRLDVFGGGRNIMRSPIPSSLALPPATEGYEYYTGLIDDENDDGHIDALSVTRTPLSDGGTQTYRMRRYRGESGSGFFPAEDNFDNNRIIAGGPTNALLRLITADIFGGRQKTAIIAFTRKFDQEPAYASWIFGIRLGSIFNYIWEDPIHIEYTSHTNLATSARITCIAAADFDNDGKIDIIAGDADKNMLRLYDNLGGGNFSPMANVGSVVNPRDLVAADVDRDGRTDIIIVAGTTNRTLSWRRNIGGVFEATDRVIASTTTADFGIPAMIDLDEDGDDDIVYTYYAGASATVRYNLWDGTGFSAPAILDTASGGGPIAAGDADGDGDQDFWVVAGNSIDFFENRAAQWAIRYTNSLWGGVNPSGVTKVVTADLNGDTWDDLIVGASEGKHIRWYPGGAGGLQAPLTINTSNHTPVDLTVADFDRDGDMDVAYALPTQHAPSFVNPGTVRIARNFNGQGAIWQDAFVMAGQPVTVLEMFNRNYTDDSAPDLIASAPSVPWTGMLLNGGNGISWSLQIPAGINDPNYKVAGAGFRSWDHIAVIRKGGNFLNNKANLIEILNPLSAYNTPRWRPPLDNTDLESNAMTRGDVDDRDGVEYIISAGTRHIYAATPGQFGNDKIGTFIGLAPGTVRQLSAVDWDRDNKPEVLSASGGGVHMYSKSSGNWITNTMISTGDFYAVVPIKLNDDVLMDAVAVASNGQIHLIHNTSVQASLTQFAPFGDDGFVGIHPGTEEPVLALRLVHHGGATVVPFQSFDAPIGFSTLRVRFIHAVLSGRNYVNGSVLSNTEITNLLDGITFYRDVGIPGVLDPADIPMASVPLLATATNGYVSINLSTAARTAQALTALQTTGNWIIGLRLKNTAGSAGVPRFFVYHYGTGSGSSVIDYSDSSNPGSIYREADAFSVRALVELGNLAFSTSVYHVVEGPGAVVNCVVVRKGPTNNAVTVQYATAPGTATNTMHYSHTSGTLTIPAGQTSGVIPVTIFNNSTYEPSRYFTVELSNPGAGGILHAPSVATVVITDDEPMPAVSVPPPVPFLEGDAGSTAVVFKVTLSQSSVQTVTVAFATQDITANSPSDYTATQGVLTIYPLHTQTSITVLVHGDTEVEINETFSLTLHSPSNAILGTASATATILDDDGLGVIEFARADFSVSETEESTNIRINRSGNVNGTASVLYSLVGGTATAGEDFQLFGTSGIRNFTAGQTSVTVMITLFDDSDVEGPETMHFNLHSPSAGSIIGVLSNTTLTILDDEIPSVIAGQVKRLDGTGVAGLDVGMIGIGQVWTTTDDEGHFQLTPPVHGAGYTLLVQSYNWIFFPTNYHFGSVSSSQSGRDFLAVTPPPLLQVDQYDGEHVILYWPVEAYEWGLVSKESLLDPAWGPSTNEIIFSADWFNVLRPSVEDDEFYSLELELP